MTTGPRRRRGELRRLEHVDRVAKAARNARRERNRTAASTERSPGHGL